MPDLMAQLKGSVSKGEIEPWKAALLAEWLQRSAPDAEPGPSPEDLARLLVDPSTLHRLKQAADGPWDTLAAQARSVLAHENVGVALDALPAE